jgi:D-alanine--poly(phosphoribitol) ligase subunit 1
MQFDFFKNSFVNTSDLGEDPFIIGTDISFTEMEVYALHLRLKAELQKLEIPKGHPVCIYGEKEALFPVVMLTLISMDIPYIPIDVIMPLGRIERIKEQTHSQVIINCSHKECEVVFDVVISKDLVINYKQKITEFSVLKNETDPIRYILFTSGSTGIPKGVQITAKALNSFVEWYLSWPLIDNTAVFMNQAPFSFDVSLCDFIGAFANGCKLVLNNYSILKNGPVFLNRLNSENANTLVCTPSFIHMYLSVPEFNERNYPQLRQVIFMGEELHANNVNKLKRAFPSLRVVNAYGPTEATVVVTYIELTDELLVKHSKSLPIGYCRPKGDIVVLHADEETGVGELGICGPNLSIGYINDSEKTLGAFVRHNGKITYKTGDVGYIKDGLIFYMGRNDSQVKLNGYRIELDEISNVLLNHPNIKNAAVVPLTVKNVTKKIICFVVVSDTRVFSNLNDDLKYYLMNHLPSYMIPSEFVLCDDFPLNSNYKTDKRALLEKYMSV